MFSGNKGSCRTKLQGLVLIKYICWQQKQACSPGFHPILQCAMWHQIQADLQISASGFQETFSRLVAVGMWHQIQVGQYQRLFFHLATFPTSCICFIFAIDLFNPDIPHRLGSAGSATQCIVAVVVLKSTYSSQDWFSSQGSSVHSGKYLRAILSS